MCVCTSVFILMPITVRLFYDRRDGTLYSYYTHIMCVRTIRVYNCYVHRFYFPPDIGSSGNPTERATFAHIILHTPRSIILSLAGRNQLFYGRRKIFPFSFPRRFRRCFASICRIIYAIRCIGYGGDQLCNIIFHSSPYNRAVHNVIQFSVFLVSAAFFFLVVRWSEKKFSFHSPPEYTSY